MDDAEDFDEVYSVASMFRAMCTMLELPQDQQKELFKAGMKGLFEPEMLGTLMDVSQTALMLVFAGPASASPASASLKMTSATVSRMTRLWKIATLNLLQRLVEI